MKSLVFILVGLICFAGSLIGLDRFNELTTHSKEAKRAIDAIQKLPECRRMIAELQTIGPIYVHYEDMPHEDYEALWDGNARMIKVNAAHNRFLGRMIGSILFELHNASTNARLKQLVDLALEGGIGKEDYVVAIERMEHENAIRTSYLLELGIRKGIFPEDARWPVFHDFDDHYRVQQLHGHSGWIAKQYNRINPRGARQAYRGTIEGLERFSEENKSDMLKYLAIKNDLRTPSPRTQQKAANALAREFNRIQSGLTSAYRCDYSRTVEQYRILNMVFAGQAFYDSLKKGSNAYVIAN